MKITFLFLLCASLFCYSFVIPSQQKISVPVKITDIRNSTGDIIMGIYTDGASFSDRKPYLTTTVSKKNLKNGVVYCNVELPAGTYGFTMLDDENLNDKMDYGFILPKEGFGFSNYYHRGLSSPKFESFAVKVDGNPKEVVIKVKYM